MAEGYNPHILDTTVIWANSWEAVTSQQIARSWKSPGILPGSTVAYLDRIYGKNIGNSAHDEEVADLFCLMKQLTCLLYTSPSPRDLSTSRMPSSA